MTSILVLLVWLITAATVACSLIDAGHWVAGVVVFLVALTAIKYESHK